MVAAETETYEDTVDSTTRHLLTLRDISGTGPATVALSSGEAPKDPLRGSQASSKGLPRGRSGGAFEGCQGPAWRIPGELEGTSPGSPRTLPERPGGHPARPETDPRRSRPSDRGALLGRGLRRTRSEDPRRTRRDFPGVARAPSSKPPAGLGPPPKRPPAEPAQRPWGASGATPRAHFSKSLVGPEHPFGGPVKHRLLVPQPPNSLRRRFRGLPRTRSEDPRRARRDFPEVAEHPSRATRRATRRPPGQTRNRPSAEPVERPWPASRARPENEPRRSRPRAFGAGHHEGTLLEIPGGTGAPLWRPCKTPAFGHSICNQPYWAVRLRRDSRLTSFEPDELLFEATIRQRVRERRANHYGCTTNRESRVATDPALPKSYPEGVGYIMPPMPPIPPSMPPPPIEAGSGLSATMASVVSSSAAIEAAF